ncbi:MAG: VWA domain-containing protein [Rubrivivax sp.]|nr:VWA domain-containing protein [Rubrivivax sp.]
MTSIEHTPHPTIQLRPSARHRARARRIFRVTLLAGSAAAALLTSQLAPAHEWTSPAVAVAAARAVQAPVQTPAWTGTLWGGVAQGAPAMPSAKDCRRPPSTFDVAGYESARPRRGEAEGGPTLSAMPGVLALRTAPSPAPAVEPPVADAGGRAEAAGPGSRERVAAARAEAMSAAHERHAAARDARAPVNTAAAPSAPPPPAGVAVAGGPARQPPIATPRPADEPVSAGMVDDNTDFGEYLAYRQRWPQLPRRDLDVSARVLLDVRDAAGRAVPDAQVRVRDSSGRELPLWARTDAGGRAWLMPQPGVAPAAGEPLEVEVRKGAAVTRVAWQPGQKDRLQARLDAPAAAAARLDVVFLVDATGSMGDEIAKLKRSMREVADQIARLPARPDLCFGLVAYRDRGDEFFVRGADLTNDLSAFQGVLEGLRAGGGGDYPEALNEALHTAVHRISWRGEGTARLVVLVADAPPHLDYPGPQYDQDLRAAQARGIKVFSVGASGLNPQGEFVFRQMAQFTGGRFVFLTYAQAARPSSGPGRETVHDVRNYSVETLDKLLVRLVSEELAQWPAQAREP